MEVTKLGFAVGNTEERACQDLNLTEHVDLDFPAWMVEALDREAWRAGVSSQAIVKIWLAERLSLQPKPARRNR